MIMEIDEWFLDIQIRGEVIVVIRKEGYGYVYCFYSGDGECV